MFLFLILINAAGFRDNLTNAGKFITKPFNRRGPIPKIHMKFHFEEGQNLEVVEEVKLLGVTIRSDLSWSSHSQQMCQKGYSRIWMLRRLRPLGANTTELLEIYRTQIQSVLEFAVAAWNAGLTGKQINLKERVKKKCICCYSWVRLWQLQKCTQYFEYGNP